MMNDELIKVTDYGAHLDRPWEQANILSPMGAVLSTRTCSCGCTDLCNKANTEQAICFPGY